jgi:DNA-binding LacI/PurR family transcriptional regulator
MNIRANSATTVKRRGRPPARRDELIQFMLESIHSGEWVYGHQIPTQEELKSRYDAYSETVHEAIKCLSEAGYLQARGRAGTFLVNRPPHLHQYALVFPDWSIDHSRFWSGLRLAANQWETAHQARIQSFFIPDRAGSAGDTHKLESLISTRALAGIVFGYRPWRSIDQPFINAQKIPRVVIGSACPEGAPWVFDDTELFLDRAIERLAQRGRKRLAAILPSGVAGTWMNRLAQLASRHQMRFEPQWVQFAMAHEPVFARHAAMLLLDPAQSQGPDALLVADDHFVEPVAEGIKTIGARTHGRGAVEVVAMCQFMVPPANPLGFTFLGFDSSSLLSTCMSRLTEQRQNSSRIEGTLMCPRFEDEPVAAKSRLAPKARVSTP